MTEDSEYTLLKLLEQNPQATDTYLVRGSVADPWARELWTFRQVKLAWTVPRPRVWEARGPCSRVSG